MTFTEENIKTFFKEIFPKFMVKDNPKINLITARYLLSFEIIKKTTSVDWIYKYLRRIVPTDKYLFHISKDKETLEYQKHRMRQFLFGEMLYNLQHVSGIQDVFSKFGREDFESTYIELEFAKYIYRSGREFHFNSPTGIKGSDYDISIVLNNSIAAGEIKSRLESLDFRPNMLIKTIKEAKQQLPKDVQNFIFIKIPEEWGKNENVLHMVTEEVKDYIDKSDRIITVILLWNVWLLGPSLDSQFALLIMINEVRNSNSELENVKYPHNIFTAKVDLGEEERWFDLDKCIKEQLEKIYI